jgi:ADP-L-glycero-D-manno-heptose 6-epimerase
MRILITGHQGFIGKNLGSYLSHKGHQVEGYEWVENKVPDPQEFDRVIHLGAISSTTERDVNKVLAMNLEFSQRLLQLCDQCGTTLIYASSASVYGDVQVHHNKNKIKENDPIYPMNAYAWSKYLFDKLVMEVPEFMINVQGLRLFNVYGPGEEHKGEQQSVFGKFQGQAKNLKKITLFEGSHDIKRDFIWVGDVCQIIEKMFDVDATDIWNIGTGTAPSFYDIAKGYATKYDAEIEFVPLPEHLRGKYQYYTCADNSKLINSIGDYKFKTIQEYIDASKT